MTNKKTREELRKEYETSIMKIWNKQHIPPTIISEYLYMKQQNESEALQMLTQEVQRSLLYNNPLKYNDYSQTVDNTITQILNQLERDNN